MALADRRKYPFAAAPLDCFLSVGRVVPGQGSAPDSWGARQNLHSDPTITLALWISLRTPGGLVFLHVPAGGVADPRVSEICRTSVANELDAGSAVRVGAGVHELLRVGCAGLSGGRCLVTIQVERPDLAAGAGNRRVPDACDCTNHAGAGDGSARRCGSRAAWLRDCNGRLQSLLLVCE